MLNPALYHQLQVLFGEVRITHEDEPLVFGTRTDCNGDRRKWKEQSGETYNVCCPICHEERFRLSISYAWGLDKEQKYPTSKLVNCFNERCQEQYDEDDKLSRGNAHMWLVQRLRNSYLKQVENGEILVKSVVKDRQKKEVVLPFPKPEWSIRPVELSEDHPAMKYIRARNFEPAMLDSWGVVLAEEYPVIANDKNYSWLAGRLFIPTPGSGWQARSVDEETKPKYFSCPGWKKSHQLYGYNKARQCSDFVLLCEGVTDVWRVDGPAVAIFGKSISLPQLTNLRKNWGLIGVLLDPDTEDDEVNSMRRAVTQLSQVGMKVFRVTLSGQKDAAMCTYSHLWDCIERSASSAEYPQVRRPHA